MDFVEICNIYVGKMTIKAAKKIFYSDKICRSYSDLFPLPSNRHHHGPSETKPNPENC